MTHQCAHLDLVKLEGGSYECDNCKKQFVMSSADEPKAPLTHEEARSTICTGCGLTLYACVCATVNRPAEPPMKITRRTAAPDELVHCIPEKGPAYSVRLDGSVHAEPTAPQVTTVGGMDMFLANRYNKSGIDTSADLSPCPFCGHEAGYKDGPRHTGDMGYHISVWCNNTSCGVHTPEHYANRTDAREAWNRRALNRGAE